MINIDKSKTIIKPDNRQTDEEMPLIHNWSRENSFTYNKDNVMLYILVEPRPPEKYKCFRWNKYHASFYELSNPNTIEEAWKFIKEHHVLSPLKKDDEISIPSMDDIDDFYDDEIMTFSHYKITSNCLGVEELDSKMFLVGKRFYFKYSARKIHNE